MSLNQRELDQLVHLARGFVAKVQRATGIADQTTFLLAMADCPNASGLTTTATASALINRYFKECGTHGDKPPAERIALLAEV